jgi:hypothetical protein
MIRTPRTRKELNFSFDDEERIGKMTLTGEGALFSEFIVVGLSGGPGRGWGGVFLRYNIFEFG